MVLTSKIITSLNTSGSCFAKSIIVNIFSDTYSIYLYSSSFINESHSKAVINRNDFLKAINYFSNPSGKCSSPCEKPQAIRHNEKITVYSQSSITRHTDVDSSSNISLIS